MNRLLKFSMVALLLFSMCFSCFAVSAANVSDSFEFSADCAKKVNVGDTFDVTVKVAQNDGIIGLRFLVEYDEDILALNSVTDDKLFDGAVIKDYYASPYQYVWISSSSAQNNSATGKIITLSFTVKKDISEDVSTCIKVITGDNDILNSDLESLTANELDIQIDISAKNQVITGDLTGDKAITSADAVYLMYYTLNGPSEYPLNQLGDFNVDGRIDSDDAIYLLYHVLFGDEYPLTADNFLDFDDLV